MSKTISHYVARFKIPGSTKGERVAQPFAFEYPDLVEPVYKEDPVIPPGVREMYYNNGNSRHAIQSGLSKEDYESWYKKFTEMGFKPFTISVNGREWSVGDKAHSRVYDNDLIIDSLFYSGYRWLAQYGKSYVEIRSLTKLPIRTPICQLSDENGKMVDMFEGDKFWWVNNLHYEMVESVINCCHENPEHNWFATLAAAEKYVLDNQPFYTRGDVEAVINAWRNASFPAPAYTRLIEKLEAFKEKHLKDKV